MLTSLKTLLFGIIGLSLLITGLLEAVVIITLAISLYENIHAQCFLEILECVLQAQYKCSAGRIHQCLLLVDNRRQWIDSGRCYMYVDDIMSLSLPLLRMNQYIVHENWSLIGLSYNRPSITILSYGLSVSLSVCLYVCKYARMYAYACMHDNARIHLYV